MSITNLGKIFQEAVQTAKKAPTKLRKRNIQKAQDMVTRAYEQSGKKINKALTAIANNAKAAKLENADLDKIKKFNVPDLYKKNATKKVGEVLDTIKKVKAEKIENFAKPKNPKGGIDNIGDMLKKIFKK